MQRHERITWAPKVRQAMIWQLYQNDARGTVDEALVEDAGYRLLQRCRSIQLATNRSLECPRCGAVFKLPESAPWRLLPGTHACPEPGCGWETTAVALSAWPEPLLARTQYDALAESGAVVRLGLFVPTGWLVSPLVP